MDPFYSEFPHHYSEVNNHALRWFRRVFLNPEITSISFKDMELQNLSTLNDYFASLYKLDPVDTLALYDAANYGHVTLNNNPSFKDWERIFIMRKGKIRDKMQIDGIPYFDTIYTHNNLWNKDYLLRMAYVADDTLSDEARKSIAQHLGIDENVKVPNDKYQRRRLVYTSFLYTLLQLTNTDKQSISAVKELPTIPNRIYEEYQNGVYLELKGVKYFDKLILEMFRTGYFSLTELEVDFEPTHLPREKISQIINMIKRWHTKADSNGNQEAFWFMTETHRAIERISMYEQHLINKGEINTINLDPTNRNLGSKLGVGVVLTNSYRLQLLNSGKIQDLRSNR